MQYAGAAGVLVLIALGLLWIKREALLQLSFAQKIVSFLTGMCGKGLNSIRRMKRIRGCFLFHTFFIWSMYFLHGLGGFQVH